MTTLLAAPTQHSTNHVYFRLATIRIADILLSIVALIVLAPLLALIWALVRSQDGGPAIFVQRRMGRQGRSFLCIKFRTMRLDAEDCLARLLEESPEARREWECDRKLRHDPRVTNIGTMLRKLSFDELPQFYNVLKGDMSLVGPRPIVAAEAGRYGSHYWTYCTVRPGLTGIWQISGRSDVRYRRRVAMDVVFARRYSLRLYMRILAQTTPALLFRRGAY
jgi:exopolysaccharide production protein ExoY